ncbi:MAG: Sodium:dicarboxylate symporter, partial [uncultured bacterium]
MLISYFDLIILILFFGFIYYLKSQKKSLSFGIITSLMLGLFYGFILKLSPKNETIDLIREALRFIGSGYLGLLKMLVIPLILTSIIHAILNLGKESHIKKMSFLACAMLLGMTALASLISIGVGVFFSVGKGMSLPEFHEAPKHTYTGLADTLLGMLPTNPVNAMAQENTIAVVLFAIFLGLAARMLDEADHDKMETFRKLIASLFAI